MTLPRIISFDEIKAGDHLEVVRNDMTRIGVADTLDNRIWRTAKGGRLVGKWDNATIYLVERPTTPLPTEPGTTILVWHDAVTGPLARPAAFTLDADGVWRSGHSIVWPAEAIAEWSPITVGERVVVDGDPTPEPTPEPDPEPAPVPLPTDDGAVILVRFDKSDSMPFLRVRSGDRWTRVNGTQGMLLRTDDEILGMHSWADASGLIWHETGAAS